MLDLFMSTTLDCRSHSIDRMKSTLANRVKEAVESAKLRGNSVVKIAAACGISKQAVYQWLDNSTKSIDGANLVELAELSGLHARWIATGKGSKISPELIADEVQPQAPPLRIRDKAQKLLDLTEKLNDDGIQTLIGQAMLLIKDYPREEKAPAGDQQRAA